MRSWVDNQYHNLFLYVPFLLAGGAATYFALPFEPNLMLACGIMGIMGTALCFKNIPILIRAILIFCVGLFYACVFTECIDTPKLVHDKHNLEISGTVQNIDYTDEKSRLYVAVSGRDIGAGDKTAIVRVSVDNNNVKLPNIGDEIRGNGGLFKPAHAYAPETFDYARWAYFNGLTAAGYINDLQIVNYADSGNINKLRNTLHRNANSFLVDSLILGYKNAVPSDDAPIWTAAGVGHVWSISGFHMTLVGGWIFLVFWVLFRAIPYVTRRVPARLPAMGCAWLGLAGYLFIAGTDVATIRAFIMTTLVFMAGACGRSAISMRNIAVAFCIIFCINPHFVMQAGFQLSFAAVFGLVWLYTVVKPKMPQNKFLKIIWACVLTSIVATVFTAPFVAMHFGAIQIYGVIGNLVLLPVFSFVIMPLVLIGVLSGTMLPIDVAHGMYNAILKIAQLIANLPCATINVPHITNAAAVCMILAFICLILIKPVKIKVNQVLFVTLSVIGVLIVCITPRPIFYATYDNELVAFVRDDGKLEFNKSRASNHWFAFDTWKQINGENTSTPNPRRKHENGIYRYGDIVYVQKFVPTMNNISKLCADDNVKYIVSYFDIKSTKCKHKILRGGFVIYPNGYVKYIQNNRRWN